MNPKRRSVAKYLLSDDEIIANAWVFLLGGFETTANALTYCSYLLATHPDIQDRVYQELIDNFQVKATTAKISINERHTDAAV